MFKIMRLMERSRMAADEPIDRHSHRAHFMTCQGFLEQKIRSSVQNIQFSHICISEIHF
jgi:hypothetical protein